MTTATGQAGKKRPQVTAQVGDGTEELDKDEEAWEEGAKYTDIEGSESDMMMMIMMKMLMMIMVDDEDG